MRISILYPRAAIHFQLFRGTDAFEDLAGNDLDAELMEDGTLGDGVLGGSLEVFVVFDVPSVNLDNRLVIGDPRALTLSGAISNDLISYTGDADRYDWVLAPGEFATIQIATNQELTATNALTLEVRDPWARLLRKVTYDSNAATLNTETIRSLTGGRYQLQVTGTRGIDYQVQLAKNTEIEIADASAATPTRLTTSATFGGTSQWAVAGASEVVLEPELLVWGVSPSSGMIVLLDPATGKTAGSFPAPGNLAAEHTQIGLTMAEGGGSLLYVNNDDDATTLYRLDPFTGEVSDTRTLEAGGGAGLGYIAGQLFQSDGAAGLRRQTFAGDPAVPGWIADVEVTAVAADDNGRTFVALASGEIAEVDVEQSGLILERWSSPVNSIVGLAFDGQLLYASSSDGQLYTISIGNDAAVRNVAIGNGLFGLAALKAGRSISAGGPSDAIDEVEPNNVISDAQNLDGLFSTNVNPNIGDRNSNTSESIPHVSVNGTGDNSYDVYSFTVVENGTRAIFDIDSTNDIHDSYLRLYNESGDLLKENDDSFTDVGQAGSTTTLDSYMEFRFAEAGVYFIEVGSCCVSDVPNGGEYTLHVSVENPVERANEWVAAGSEWRYWDQGGSPGLLWTLGSDVFDDTAWSTGRAQLGYGDGDEATVVGFGDNDQQKHPATFFRKAFTVTDPARVERLWVDLLRDDGAAVYLNGEQVIVDRLNTPTEFDAFATGAAVQGDNESTFFEFEVDPSLLVVGENVIAVQVHQRRATDEDLSFDLRLRGALTPIEHELPVVRDTDIYQIDLTGFAGERLDVGLKGQFEADLSSE